MTQTPPRIVPKTALKSKTPAKASPAKKRGLEQPRKKLLSKAKPKKPQPLLIDTDPEERLRLILDSARDFAVFTTDLEGLVTTWNEGARRLFGYEEDEIIGEDGRLLFTEEDQASGAADDELRKAVQEGRAEDDRWHLRKDEEKIWGSGLAMALRDRRGRVCGVLKIMRDLTNRKLADEALKRSAKKLREVRQSVESTVEQRTKHYRKSNEQLRIDLAERQKLERIALEVAEREQRRIGQDLHDTLCQHVAGLSLEARALAQRMHGAGEEVVEQVREIGASLQKAANDLREVARGLYPVELERGGIVGALQELCGAAERSGKKCQLVCPEAVLTEDTTKALHIYRIAQELVTNALKHSDANQITISLLRNGYIMLQVSDDGKGFDAKELPSTSMGLHMMRYRANALGAKLKIVSAPGKGTTVSCKLRR